MKHRILFKTSFGDFASDWEELTNIELQDLHVSVQALVSGATSSISIVSKKSKIYISSEMAQRGVVIIQEQV